MKGVEGVGVVIWFWPTKETGPYISKIHFNPLQPFSTHFNPPHKNKTNFNLLLPTSPIYQPLFTDETNSPETINFSWIKLWNHLIFFHKYVITKILKKFFRGTWTSNANLIDPPTSPPDPITLLVHEIIITPIVRSIPILVSLFFTLLWNQPSFLPLLRPIPASLLPPKNPDHAPSFPNWTWI